MIQEISNVTFHRNGVSGNSYFSLLAKTNIGNLLLTFEYSIARLDRADRRSLRAINIDDLKEKYRGDEIADDLNKWFLNNGVTDIYELTLLNK